MCLGRYIQKLRAQRGFALRRAVRFANTGSGKFSCKCRAGGCNDRRDYMRLWLWGTIVLPATLVHEIYENSAFAKQPSSDSSSNGTAVSGLYRVEDGSVISNVHTSKWRVFTDKGRDLFIHGRLEEAEKYFISALEEAKEGFGLQDPHVASAYNNLAELYRVKKAFDKAEPLYMEAIHILEESFGKEDVRVGSALHNLGQFYLVQRKIKEAYSIYERALKIKARILGHGSPDYANTLYHLGVAAHNLGDIKEAAAIIQDSIRIEEEANEVDRGMCIKRLRYLAQMYLKSHLLDEAEGVQRKILHLVELSKGWSSLETVFSAENLAMTLQLLGKLQEAAELLEHCLDSRKVLLPVNHVQIAANMLSLAHVAVLDLEFSESFDEIPRMKYNLQNSVRIALDVFNRYLVRANVQDGGASDTSRQDAHTALLILTKSLHVLELLENVVAKSQGCMGQPSVGFGKCIAYFRELRYQSSADSSKMKTDYPQCLEEFMAIVEESTSRRGKHTESVAAAMQDLRGAIKCVQAQLSSSRQRHQTVVPFEDNGGISK